MIDTQNTASDFGADTACRSAKNETWMAERGLVSRIYRKKPKGRAMAAHPREVCAGITPLEALHSEAARTFDFRANLGHLPTRRRLYFLQFPLWITSSNGGRVYAEPLMAEPDWLIWTRELQAIAQTGLAFVRDPYDRERYEALRLLASRMMAAHTATPVQQIEALFAGESGYATPKVDVRGATFDDRGRLLMVREVADGGRWTLPGGWADVNLSAAESVIKEIREESGFEVRVRKLAAVWDRSRQGHPAGVFSCCKLFFICSIIGGMPATGLETSEVGWFAEDDLPNDLSLGRVLPRQIRRMFVHARDPALPAEFD